MADASVRRRGHGEDAICFAADKNRYIGAVSVGFGPDGKRLRRKVSGKTKHRRGSRRRTSAAQRWRPRSARGYSPACRRPRPCGFAGGELNLRTDLAVALAVGAALALLRATVADVSEPESAGRGG
jgi:hypothetical protein